MEQTQKILGAEIDYGKINSPYQFYRALRPYYFSDSRIEKQAMSREMFKYVLSQLSKDMRQDAFEEFTRQLIVRLITPNIIPQTGPTGGGDAKADLETHPVSNEVANKWYLTGAKDNERWAFAISCKNDWKSKIKHDIQSVISTGKGFTRFYFCTNQPVPAKDKLKYQTDFKTLYDIDTTILDSEWYEQSVYDNGCYKMAVETLGLGKDIDEVRVEGPLDIKRKKELEMLEEKKSSTQISDGIDVDYVSDLLRCAILSRELEYPTNETEKRFALALNAAEKHGLSQQIFEINYQLGWTYFYWFENPDKMYEQYQKLKQITVEAINPNKVERLFTLYSLTTIAIKLNLFKSKNPSIEEESNYWEDLYNRLSQDMEHKISFLYLKIFRLESQLLSDIRNGKSAPDTIKELSQCFDEAKNSIDIPIETFSTFIDEYGRYIVNEPELESLIDKIADVQRKSQGDIAYANTHYARGVQMLEQDNDVEAIRHLGQSVIGYQQAGTIHELIRVCGLLGSAYEKRDLLNAAKLMYVKAIALLFHLSNTKGELHHIALTLHYSLCNIELRMGNVNSFLNWYAQLAGLVNEFPQYIDEWQHEQEQFDFILGTLFLKDSLNNLPDKMPSILQRMGLHGSASILLYRTGNLGNEKNEFEKYEEENKSWKEDILAKLPNDYLLHDLNVPNDFVIHHSLIQGCRFDAECENNIDIICITDLILALVESLLSTSNRTEFVFMRPIITLKLGLDDNSSSINTSKHSGEYILKCHIPQLKDKKLYDFVIQVLATIISQNISFLDSNKFFDEKEKKEKIGERLAVFAMHRDDLKSALLIGQKLKLDDWAIENDVAYPHHVQHNGKKEISNVGKQAQDLITDTIDVSMWDQAKWKGCGYMTTYDHSEPPIMIFLFENMDAAKKIFEKWENDYRNQKLNLQITIITGIDKSNPYWYKVLLAPDINRIKDMDGENGRYVLMTSRYHLMQAQNNTNLLLLRADFGKFHFVGISACGIENGQMTNDSQKIYPKVIPIKDIVFREAWTIADNTLEQVAIQATDNPIIPAEHEKDAPVIKVLEKRKRYGK